MDADEGMSPITAIINNASMNIMMNTYKIADYHDPQYMGFGSSTRIVCNPERGSEPTPIVIWRSSHTYSMGLLNTRTAWVTAR